MNHEMGLYPENFETVKSGQKRREYRLQHLMAVDR